MRSCDDVRWILFVRMNRRLGSLQERTLCGMCWDVGLLGGTWEEAESCRVHVQVRVPIQRRRGDHAGTTTGGDSGVSSVGRSRALLELVSCIAPLFKQPRRAKQPVRDPGHHMG